MKKVQFFSEPLADTTMDIDNGALNGLSDYGVTYEVSDSTVTFYVEVDDCTGTKKIARAGDDLYYLDGENGYCIHYALSNNGCSERGIITELFECRQWFLFLEAGND